MALPNETSVRSTDIASEVRYRRIGNDSNGNYKNLLESIDSTLGFPIEIKESTNPGEIIVSSSSYQLPNGEKIAYLKLGESNSKKIATNDGLINLTTGVISISGNSIASVPSALPITPGHWVGFLVQFNPDNSTITVTKDNSDSDLNLVNSGSLLPGYYPIYVVNVKSTNGTSFDLVSQSEIYKIANFTSSQTSVPSIEKITVTTTGSVFPLTKPVPKNRDRALVFLNGVLLSMGASEDYEFSDDDEITFSENLPVDAVITVRV